MFSLQSHQLFFLSFVLSQTIDMVFVFVFLLEMAIKLTVLGWHDYIESFSNRVDAFLTVLGVVGAIIGWMTSNVSELFAEFSRFPQLVFALMVLMQLNYAFY